ncbi:glycosyltransferase family 4 protein, partial [Candidatus Falkowbacteria bacterium]|nr:glycosyltransferase family 4 protein [Candidatus Falkowbacteria bacterium]
VPSVFHEPFGLVALEAFGYGKPVIVSDRGALPEVVDEGETGLIVPADDAAAWNTALLRLMINERLRHTMGKHARKVAELLYTPEGHYTKLIEWYEELIEKKISNSQLPISNE